MFTAQFAVFERILAISNCFPRQFADDKILYDYLCGWVSYIGTCLDLRSTGRKFDSRSPRFWVQASARLQSSIIWCRVVRRQTYNVLRLPSWPQSTSVTDTIVVYSPYGLMADDWEMITLKWNSLRNAGRLPFTVDCLHFKDVCCRKSLEVRYVD